MIVQEVSDPSGNEAWVVPDLYSCAFTATLIFPFAVQLYMVTVVLLFFTRQSELVSRLEQWP